MKNKSEIFLPGGFQLANFLINNTRLKDTSILIIGFGAEEIAKKFIELEPREIFIIVDNDESLLTARLSLSGIKTINVRLMSFDKIDFHDSRFDIVFAQGSVSSTNRKNIFSEIKRVLTNKGIFCNGEIIRINKIVPKFISDIWDRSDIDALTDDELKYFFNKMNFSVKAEINLTATLKNFYKQAESLLRNNVDSLPSNEKSFRKKIINRISHESKVFLYQGGDKYIGFKGFILHKDVK